MGDKFDLADFITATTLPAVKHLQTEKFDLLRPGENVYLKLCAAFAGMGGEVEIIGQLPRIGTVAGPH